jgi:adenylate kinase
MPTFVKICRSFIKRNLELSMSNSSDVKVQNHDLEIKDANIIFKAVWSSLESKFGKTKLIFPKEIIWLGGAPGAGKGTNTPFIQNERDFVATPIVVSSLLDSDEAKEIKEAGGMVGDREVIGLLLARLLGDEYENGVIVDGFPRTQVQVECLKMFYNKTIELKNEFSQTPLARKFRYPQFRITVLFVSEKVSVERQLSRGQSALVEKQAGTQDVEIRATDFNESLARNRYRTFKEQTYDALSSLKDIFHYHFVNAEGDLEEVEWNIAKEFQYQSSLELDEGLFEDMRDVPLATELVVQTRQELVRRLEDHRDRSRSLFLEVIDFVTREVIPDVIFHLTSGFSTINSRDPLLNKPGALNILVDVLAERGFNVAVDSREEYKPVKLDLMTGDITCDSIHHHLIKVQFQGSDIRRGL